MKKNIFFIFLLFNSLAFGQNPDINLLKKINLNRNKNFDPTCKFLSNSLPYIALSIPTTISAIGLISKDETTKRNGYMIGAAFTVSTLTTTSLKYIIKRKRPYQKYDFIDNATTASTPSFPSGHTSAAFSVATAVSLASKKWYVVVPSYAWACSVAWSRMHLGVHYPLDVLVGAIIGSLSAFLCYEVNSNY